MNHAKNSSPVFDLLKMVQLTPDTFDSELAKTSQVSGVFFWGHDCPNCEMAKKSLLENSAEILELHVTWFHVNTYKHFELGTRFGLFGIPTFLFFKGGRKLGKITPYPGIDPFIQALRKLA